MSTLTEHDVFIFIAQLGVILFAARLCGEIAKRLGQPVLAGEVVAGILLGPAVFGKIFLEGYNFLFPSGETHGYLLDGISWLCALFLLMIAGLEIDFKASLKYGKQNILTSLFGFAFPFLGILVVSDFLPKHFYPPDTNPYYVNLLLATALSVASVPVIGKILFDLKIFRSNVGLNIITSSVMSDIWEWSTLLVVISLLTHGNIVLAEAVKPVAAMLLFLGLVLTLGRNVTGKIFDWLKISANDTVAVLAVIFSLTLLNSAITYILGIHVLFGAFLTGLMLGESDRITPYMRQSIQDFIFGIFAPIFFVLIGMQLELGAKTNWLSVVALFGVASLFKIGGAFLGALLGGIGKKNALAVGCGLNTQGAMGIVVALIGVHMGAFTQELFSVVVIICILSSLLVGPLLKWAIRGVQRPLAKYFDKEHVFLDIPGNTKRAVIQNIVKEMAKRNIIQNPELVSKAVWQREESLSTAMGEGIALPHARIPNLKTPILCFFKLKNSVDFASPDNLPVQFLFVELTDSNDDGMQLNLISQVARFLANAENKRRLISSTNEEEIAHVLRFDEKI